MYRDSLASSCIVISVSFGQHGNAISYVFPPLKANLNVTRAKKNSIYSLVLDGISQTDSSFIRLTHSLNHNKQSKSSTN